MKVDGSDAWESHFASQESDVIEDCKRFAKDLVCLLKKQLVKFKVRWWRSLKCLMQQENHILYIDNGTKTSNTIHNNTIKIYLNTVKSFGTKGN